MTADKTVALDPPPSGMLGLTADIRPGTLTVVIGEPGQDAPADTTTTPTTAEE